MRFRADPLSAAAHASSAGTPAAGNAGDAGNAGSGGSGGRASFGEYAGTTVAAAGGAVTSEKDFPSNDPIARAYDMSKRDHYFSDAERRKPLPYLK